MASYSQPRIYTFQVAASVAKGKAVKFSDSTGEFVIVGAANTDKCIGIAQNEAVASGDFLEVALQGGGAKALLTETTSAGNDLCSHTDGSLALVNAEGDQILARAMEDGVAGDLISVEVYYATAHASQSA